MITVRGAPCRECPIEAQQRCMSTHALARHVVQGWNKLLKRWNTSDLHATPLRQETLLGSARVQHCHAVGSHENFACALMCRLAQILNRKPDEIHQDGAGGNVHFKPCADIALANRLLHIMIM